MPLSAGRPCFPAQSSSHLSLVSGRIVTTNLSALKPKADTDPAAPPSCLPVGVPSGVCGWLQCPWALAPDSYCQVPLSSPLEPRLEMIKRSELRHQNLRKQMKLTDCFTHGDFSTWSLYDTFHLKILSQNHRSLNIFNGITIRFLRLWCSSLYKGRPAPALSLKIPCPHLFPCLLNFPFYITSPLNNS